MSGAVHPALMALRGGEFVRFEGTVSAIGQNRIEARGPFASVGDFCTIPAGSDGDDVLAQVVAVGRDGIRLLPLAPIDGVRIGAPVVRRTDGARPRVGDGFAGRAVDAFGNPIDAGPAIADDAQDNRGKGPGKLDRVVLPERVTTGIRAIDAMIPIAKGQRIGIFAASGVGKTTLIEQISQSVECDHCILCLVGERGREVERLWRMHSSGGHAARTTLVAATSEESAIARIRALDKALALAEHWRSRGRHVVLFVDSVTRLAMALREVGLAAGEPPALRSYTPNVFSAMPSYVERCGGDRNSGAITAIFTVLAETDELDDPIVELLKSLLDGHIVLSRKLADKAHYPPIDIGASVSRVAGQVMEGETLRAATVLRKLFAEFEDARTLIESGIYRDGSNPAIDRAIRLQPSLVGFLQQENDAPSSLAETDAKLIALAGEAG